MIRRSSSVTRRIYRNVSLVCGASWDVKENCYVPAHEMLAAVYSFAWPNGRPCILIEMYLFNVRHGLTVRDHDGGSLRIIVSDLSRIAEFCWARDIDFWEVLEADLAEFSMALSRERNVEMRYVRNANTVRRIMSVAVDFIVWCKALLGTPPLFDSSQDAVQPAAKGNGAYAKRLLHVVPRPDARRIKQPLPTAIRNKLWDAVSSQYHWSVAREVVSTTVADYLRARRELTLILLECTGCRPSELIRLDQRSFRGPISSRTIQLPTLKRRMAVDPERRIPLSPEVALKIENFVAGPRAGLIRKLQSQGKLAEPTCMIFLDSTDGSPLTIFALQKDFQRLVQTAAPEQDVCMSMFRHRFVTNMIRIHLQAYMVSGGKERLLLADPDYRSILRRICAFTGHGNEKSLLNYIDWAQKELGTFGSIDALKSLQDDLQIAGQTLRWMRQEEKVIKNSSKSMLLYRLDELVDSLSKSIRQALR